MCGLLVLLFTVVPTIELFFLIKIGQHVGATPTVGLVLFTGVLGAALCRIEGWRTISLIRQDMAQGILPGRRLLDGLLILIGSVLLITPGVITDILGLCMIFPLTRPLFREALIRILKKKILDEIGIITIGSRNIYDSREENNDIKSNDIRR
jgi:UPF0716 protein FxsA